MITAQSMPMCRDVVIKATIMQLIHDGSKTFTVKTIRRESEKNYGLNITSQAINQYLVAHPALKAYGNLPKYWKLEGEL